MVKNAFKAIKPLLFLVILLSLFIVLSGTVSAATVVPSNGSVNCIVANDNGARFNDYANVSGWNNTYNFFSPGQSASQGSNALHMTNDTSNSAGSVIFTNSTSGTFYISDTGGRGWDDNGILMLAINGTIPSNFRITITASGYQWTPVATGSYPTYSAVTYVPVSLNETFTSADFVYGPQYWRPSPGVNAYYPIYDASVQNTSNTFYLMFIDLNAGILGANTLSQSSFSGQTVVDKGMIKVSYVIENLPVGSLAAFDAYAYTVSSNQGQGIRWTNRLSASGSSGYSVIGVPNIPTANFNADVTNGTSPLTVQFNDNSLNFPTSWAWDFDNDGVVDSTLQNPTWSYTTPGIYTVVLNATNSMGSNMLTKTDYITVNWPAPVANFGSNVTNGTDPLDVSFSDASTGNLTGWAWDFDNDGVVDSNLQNPTWTYALPGVYSVTETVTGPGGNNTMTKTGFITVFNATQPTVTADPDSGVYNSTKNVTLSCDQPNCKIYYTIDGSDPTDSGNSNRIPYSGAIPLTGTTLLTFAAVNEGGIWSQRYSKNYVIDLSTPLANAIPSGGLFNSTQSVTLNATDADSNVTIYYTLNGSDPKVSGVKYGGPISISTTTTLRYIAVDDAGNWSLAYSETYVIDTIAPTANGNVKGGVYTTDKVVVLNMSENGTIYYTLNGSNPTVTSNKYTGPITISATTVLKFVAVDLAGNWSPVYTEQYVIDKSAPVVMVTSPVNGAIKVSQTSTIVIKFNEKILSSINWSKVYMKNLKTGKYVSISKWISGNTLNIKMVLKRYHLTWYSIYIPASAIKDSTGHNLAKAYSFKFKTI